MLKVARTIADLAGDKAVKDSHLAEALAYREVFPLKDEDLSVFLALNSLKQFGGNLIAALRLRSIVFPDNELSFFA